MAQGKDTQKKETALEEIKKIFDLTALNAGFSDALLEEMDGLETTFDRVKIPAGGGLTFEVPGEDPEEPEMSKEIIGIIVDKHPVNAYWEEEYSGANTPPTCVAIDGKFGVGHPGGQCSSCPLNEWGSDEGQKGKACKNLHRVYILRSGESFPILLTLPPTSIKNFSGYIAKRVLSKGLRTSDVVTSVTLKKTANAKGIPYSQAVFKVAGVLNPEQRKTMKDYVASIKTTTREIGIYQDELASHTETDTSEFGTPEFDKDDSGLPM